MCVCIFPQSALPVIQHYLLSAKSQSSHFTYITFLQLRPDKDGRVLRFPCHLGTKQNKVVSVIKQASNGVSEQIGFWIWCISLYLVPHQDISHYGRSLTFKKNPEQEQPTENTKAAIPATHITHPKQHPCTCLHVLTTVKGPESPSDDGTGKHSLWVLGFGPQSFVNWVIVALCRSRVQGHLQSQVFAGQPRMWPKMMGGNSKHYHKTQKRAHLLLITM